VRETTVKIKQLKDENRLKDKAQNQYRSKVAKVFSKYTNANGITTLSSDIDIPKPTDGDWWGSWRL
jgi:hypothetical protein